MPAPGAHVLAQDPDPGARVPAGSLVALEYALPARRVPKVVGLTLDDARKTLSEGGWGVGPVSTERDTTSSPGRVVRQEPAADVAADVDPSGDPIRVALVVAATPTERASVTTPDVIGLPIGTATERMQAAGLEVGRREPAAVAGRAADEVVAQDPEAGREVPRGTAATLRYARPAAPPSPHMPDVIGMRMNRAEDVVRSVGLTVGRRVPKIVAGAAADEVVDQLPKPGEAVPRGQLVTLVYAQPPPLVPAVAGQRLADAQAILSRVNLRVKVLYQEARNQDPDVVLNQTPAANTPVSDPPQVVELVVSKPVAPAPEVMFTVFALDADRPAADDLVAYLRRRTRPITDYRVRTTTQRPSGVLYYSAPELEALARDVAAATLEHLKTRGGPAPQLEPRLRPMRDPQIVLYLPAPARDTPDAPAWRAVVREVVRLRPGMSVDIDRGIVDDSAAADVALERALVPRDRASLATQRGNTLDGCLAAKFGRTSIEVERLVQGATVCVRTNSGAVAVVGVRKVEDGVTLAIKTWVPER
jgi:beta-lactam-binding protein with PASTA domain